MTPEERAKWSVCRFGEKELDRTDKILGVLEQFVADAIRAAVEAEQAKYARVIEAADELTSMAESVLAHEVDPSKGYAAGLGDCANEYRAARKELP